MKHNLRVGDWVRLNGHLGRVVNRWTDADAARRRDDDGGRVALVLENGRVLANVRSQDVLADGAPVAVVGGGGETLLE